MDIPLLAYFAAHAPTPPLGLEDHIRARLDYAEAMLAEYNRRCPPKDYAKPWTAEDVIRGGPSFADAMLKPVGTSDPEKILAGEPQHAGRDGELVKTELTNLSLRSTSNLGTCSPVKAAAK